jgi:cytidylate kinase
VTDEIRTQDISQKASLVSAHKVVRDMLLDMQRDVAKRHNVIMDGRDIGTVVLPKATVKIFLSATPEIRAQRRTDELTVDIEYDEDGRQHMIMNGMDVTEEIRTQDISQKASLVSAHKVVRDMLLDMQRDVARHHNVIMDGRDIGTVVLPNATVKIFLTASAEVRAKRRTEELMSKGQKVSYEQTLKDIKQRDHQDSNRPIAPLKQAKDAVLLDTSELDIDGVIAQMKRIVGEKIGL